MKKVIAVVVTYNRKELLKECVQALLNQDYKGCSVLVVDNASTDGTLDYIEEYIDNDKVYYKNTGANLGGAGGFNFGIKEAYKMGCDFVWLMDDDCIVHKDSLTELIKADEELNGKYGFLSSKVLWKDGTICKMNIQKTRFSKWLTDYERNMQEIAMASFVSLFLKTSIIRELGLPIKDFFIWTDDWEYTRRISLKYKCYYISKSVVTHKSKNNVGASIDFVDDRLERFNYLYRNDVVLYRREGIKGWLLLYLRLILHKYRILKSDKKDKKERINIINKAIQKGKQFHPKIEFVYDLPIRVLQLFGEPLSNGGQESAIMNFYRNINREKIQFDFFTPFYCDNQKLKKDIEKLGGKLFFSNGKFDTKFRKYNFIKNTRKFLKENSYEIIHINSGSIFELAEGAKLAHKYGAKKVITHSHLGGQNNLKYRLVKKVFGRYFVKYATDCVACSELAAKWKYPNEIIENKKYTIIKNGIDLDKFSFNSTNREKYRKNLEIEDKKVLINIGRLAYEKNQLFLIEIMKELKNIDSKFILLIVGEGIYKAQIEKKIKEYDLEENIKLLGIRKDVPELLSASDIFVFSSLWEGSPVSTVEAQDSGLPVICSTNVTEEAKILDSFIWCNLDKGAKKWANEIIKLYDENINVDRNRQIVVLEDMGFSSKDATRGLEEIYLKEIIDG